MKDKLRLMAVDDSMVMRKMIQQLLASESWIEVVDTATNGQEALEKTRILKPDLITMDIRMPVMDGLQALRAIMRDCPTRVIMLSAFTTEGADETLEALEAGAVDFMPKGEEGKPPVLREFRERLLAKIRTVAGSHLVKQATPAPVSPPPVRPSVSPSCGKTEILLIGTSTGGPNALQAVIPRLPADLPVGVLVVQHMPATFTAQLATRLDRNSQLQVKEAEEGDRIQPGRVLLAPGDRHLVIREKGVAGLDEEPAASLHRPAVDVLMASAAEIYGAGALGVIMTGMGQDGKQGLSRLKAKGGRVIAQDEASCVVYGMPRAVVEAGLADRVCPLAEIPASILACM